MAATKAGRRVESRISAWFDRAIEWGAALPTWATVLIIAGLLGGSWMGTYFTGGTQRAFPHLFYVPIILAVLPFKVRGAVATALVASVLCGPLMPLNSVTGEPQQVNSYLFRTVMFVMVAVAAGLAGAARERFSDRQLSSDVHRAMERVEFVAAVDEDAVLLVPEVLERRRFHPVFQPLYSLDDGRLLAVEALTRFDVTPYRTPDVWFRAAATGGHGVDLEIAALEAALRAASVLPLSVAVSLNASPATLLDPRLDALLHAHRDRRLIMEITEHAIVEDYHLLQGTVDRLRALGVRIAVDDAGAGFSSLQHIVQLSPETIKLDISLTQGVAGSQLRRALAGALISFAQRSGAELVVEGIEEVSDLTTWTTLGAHAAQGYLLGRPGPLPVPEHSVLIASLRGVRV